MAKQNVPEVGSFFGPDKKYHSHLLEMRRRNNPENKPTGHHTGRCPHCGSKDLWDDNSAYGCNSCGSILSTG